MPKYRGKCRVCQREFALTQDGRVRAHRRFGRFCPGGGEPTHEVIRVPDGWMNSTFKARALPEAIWIGEEAIAGPFCVHCGNPLTMHGEDNHCPNRILHPTFPAPTCECHGLKQVVTVT